ncbi:MAG: metallophosphoesterase [Vibrio sp.]
MSKKLFIGDIHGQVEKLDALLSHFDLEQNQAQLVFVGDLIDNGKDATVDHLALLNKVKDLVDAGKAHCVMGNHEFNAVGWVLKKPDGSYCRDRNKPSNIKQHQVFLAEVKEDSAEHKKWIEWFKSRPVFLDFGDVRTIHACWHQESIEKIRPYLNDDNTLKEAHWFDAFDKNHELYQLIENLLKGPEVELPTGCSFKDKTGTERFAIRTAWWKEASTIETYQDLAVVPKAQSNNIPDVTAERTALAFNKEMETPVVIGHYTLDQTSQPQLLSQKVICVDFNAAKADNPLVGYYFDPEKAISAENFIQID